MARTDTIYTMIFFQPEEEGYGERFCVEAALSVEYTAYEGKFHHLIAEAMAQAYQDRMKGPQRNEAPQFTLLLDGVVQEPATPFYKAAMKAARKIHRGYVREMEAHRALSAQDQAADLERRERAELARLKSRYELPPLGGLVV